MPSACGNVFGCSRGPILRGIGADREHQRVVVPVVRALDLDDHLATGVRPHETGGLERGFRAGIAEPPEREAEALDQAVADRVEVLRGLREMRATLDLSLDRLDDLRVRVADDHGAVAKVEVEVLVAVDVPQPVAQAVVDVDRVRRRSLPAGGDASGDRALRDLAIRDRCAVLRFELRFLIRDQCIYTIEVDIDRLVDDHGFRLLAKSRRSPRDDPQAVIERRFKPWVMIPHAPEAWEARSSERRSAGSAGRTHHSDSRWYRE